MIERAYNERTEEVNKIQGEQDGEAKGMYDRAAERVMLSLSQQLSVAREKLEEARDAALEKRDELSTEIEDEASVLASREEYVWAREK